MPFKPGIGSKEYGGGGRKGFELEAKQLKRMLRILDKDLALVEKVQSGKATPKEISIYTLIAPRVSKYLDKIHANKTDIKLDIEKPIMIL